MKKDFIEIFNEVMLCNVLEINKVIDIGKIFGITFKSINKNDKKEQMSVGMAIIFDVEPQRIFSEIKKIINLTENDINEIFQKYDFLIEDIKTEKLPEIIKNILK